MDMWAKRSHLIHPLTALTSLKELFKWTEVEQKAFNEIKRTVSCEALLIYSDFNKYFDIHADASDLWLVEVIIQDGKPIAFYRRKLTGLQTQHIVTET